MSRKSNIIWRIKALFFTGAITAASLRGCTYGPPPVDQFIKTQQNMTQNIDKDLINVKISPSYNIFTSTYEEEIKSGNSAKTI